ncbi:MAG: hypothetical protein ABSC63_08225 [Candidatus Binataceae bacterium]
MKPVIETELKLAGRRGRLQAAAVPSLVFLPGLKFLGFGVEQPVVQSALLPG